MKKLLFSLACLSIFWSSEAQPIFTSETFEDESEPIIQQESSYIFRLRFPLSKLKIPTLAGFYKGYRLNFSPDLCVIKESRSCPSFCIVIAEDISINGDDHALKRLEQVPSKKYRMFYFIKNIKKDGSIEWTTEEENSENIPHILPKNAVIILFHPDYIEGMASPRKEELIKPLHKQIKTGQEEVVHLPVIEVKKEITQQEINTICKASCCASVDMRGVHRPTKVTKKNDTLRFISLARPRKIQAQ